MLLSALFPEIHERIHNPTTPSTDASLRRLLSTTVLRKSVRNVAEWSKPTRIPEKIRQTVGDDRKVSTRVGLCRSLHSQICVTVQEFLSLMGGEHGGRRGPALHTGGPGDVSSPEGARGGTEDRKSTGGG